ncbi:hypothetical protein BDF20DRAFT_833587 [Mycotypha africana]|uniref:uncharacterized protein n=1 Tax=Mycotypha africana TaxID=64632 RepID=UPI002301652D|nr:uncharacterized protein BDF20DRAFT_833587 [Mycotypha africana]KAI8984047.1 hypothetical protein BDF20DRAFT_833587 [Mycotypha africana]
MANIVEVATAFTNFYYQTFDSSRQELAPLYRDASMLTFEGQQFKGVQGIVEKLVSLPFGRVQHKVITIDAQPGNDTTGSIIVSVTGALLVDDEQNPQLFTQTFQLIPEGSSYYVFNDIFRLVYGL